MSRVSQTLTAQYKFCVMDADAKRPRGYAQCGHLRTPADEGRGSKIGKILQTSLWMTPKGLYVFRFGTTVDIRMTSVVYFLSRM